MAIPTVVAAGTAQALAATNATTPTLRWCNRCTIIWVSGGTLYIGLPGPLGKASAVSPTNYDVALNETRISFTIGPTKQGNGVDLGSTYVDASSSGTAYTLAPVTA